MHPKLADAALGVELITAAITGAACDRRRYWASTPHACDEDDEMNAGNPGQDNSGEPAPAPDPWSEPADFGEPAAAAAAAQPAPPAQAAQPAPPAQAAQPAPPTQPAPPPSESGGFISPAPAAWSAPAEWTAPTPTPWPAPDASATGQPAGNGFGPADADPWAAQPSVEPSAGQQAAAPTGQQGGAPAGQYVLPARQFGPPTAGPYGYQSPYYTPTTVRTNPVAIAALVCGIAQILGFVVLLGNVLLAVPAVICGAIALRQVQARGERGRGMAIAGLVLGIIGIALFVLFLGLVILGLVFAKNRGA